MWFRRGRLLIISPDSRGTARPLSGRNYTYRPVQILEAGSVCAYWRTKEDFARDGVPKIFFDMFPNYGTISQGGWDERKTFEYLYATGTEEGVFGCLARFHQGFFAYGFTVDDAGVLPEKQKQTG